MKKYSLFKSIVNKNKLNIHKFLSNLKFDYFLDNYIDSLRYEGVKCEKIDDKILLFGVG